MSMFDIESGAKKVAKYNHWPNPFKFLIKYFGVTACEDTLQFEIEWWGFGLLAYWFDNFIPGPRELERKFATGAYKCGFFGFHGVPNALDLIWEDGTAGRAVLEIASPAIAPLYYLWMLEVPYGAMAQVQSMIYAMAKCDTDRYECLLGNASAALPPGVHNGGPVQAQVIWDPNNWNDHADNAVVTLGAHDLHATAYGYLSAVSHIINNAYIILSIGVTELARQEMGSMQANEVKAWRLEYAGASIAGAIKVEIYYDIAAGGIANPVIECTRFTVRQTPTGIPNRGTPGLGAPPSSPNPPCSFLTRFYDTMS